ncbi:MULTISPECIES: CaiB/BaiF CoA transferase family protein [Virgibacillus]|uniref:CaiB/BaiF CoA transferase family protein n=1 Tax=Virgibacillus TaxID=84406 RepID=UPI0004CF61DF|nr:CoA transferase [Virgibacillus massiliensis]MYL40427.1 CoA transferase [Virgibacillus massiliensis]
MIDVIAALEGLRVIELGSLIAGPFAGRLFAEFGADVIKIEPPKKGDPLREWRYMYDGKSLWWSLQARNKKSVTIDLKSADGQELVRKLIDEADIVIANFRPGTLEKWNLGYEQLAKRNPKVIMVLVSGFGQSGPYRDKPGFGSIGESMGGIRYITGYPELPPPRVGISIGDSLAALYSVIGALMAVYHRDVRGTKEGQLIDVALYESVFSLMESLLPEYDKFGVVRKRTGAKLPGITPSNTYPCKDGKYIVIGGNGDSIFQRFMHAIDRADIAEDERFRSNSGRSQYADFLDKAINDWTKQVNLDKALTILDEANVPAGPIYSIEDIVKDPQYMERDMIQTYSLTENDTVKIPGIVPRMSKTPGRTNWLGPDLGTHTVETLRNYLNLTEQEIQDLQDKGII